MKKRSLFFLIISVLIISCNQQSYKEDNQISKQKDFSKEFPGDNHPVKSEDIGEANKPDEPNKELSHLEERLIMAFLENL